MTILYIPVLNLERANILKELFWELTNPNSQKLTKYYASPIVHPKTGEIRLPIESKFLPIHQNADEHIFDDFLQFFVNAGYITSQEVTDVQNKINAHRNTKVNLQEMLPAIWFQQLVNEQYLEDNGWFALSSEDILVEESLEEPLS
jgi:hypothetical protein